MSKLEIEITDTISKVLDDDDNYDQCDRCHKWTYENKLTEVDGKLLCSQCIKELNHA